ncbi:hypothetical protein EW146_g3281 [Bondarzewia mesenterica]|uniref:Protein kinase domain-containing protein n=1 Tax=Bondarzewia mesenterica TaxID=1095465 RepID=A0A4S4LYI2_9AGAM|nr:hypothetical protein EW146_g3281 [Bondarzewia mesenterica]
MSNSPPRPPPVLYNTRYGTRWQKEKAAAGHGAFEYPEDARYVGPWIIGECVGKGASGHVKIAKHRRTGQLAAVKVLPLDFTFNSHTSLRTRQAKSEKQRLGIDREIIMMKLMNHPNIMRIYDVYEGDNELYLILEYVEGGELFDFLVNRGKLPPLEALAYFKQIIYGLNYAHAFSIIHRDLKPENILIHSLNPPLIKIADWGMAAFAPPYSELETSCGSPHYASPEIVHGQKYQGTATDIWSCGVILFALLTGRLPFDDKNVRTLLGKVKLGKYDMPSWVDPQAKDLLSRMLVVDVAQRITMPEILAHPWLANPTPGVIYVPAPSVKELACPLQSADHINSDVFEYLCVIWGRLAEADRVKADLLSPAGKGTLAKAFYFLLQKHREKTFEEDGIFMDIDENANYSKEKAITRLYMAPLSKKPRPLSVEIKSTSLVPPPLVRGTTVSGASTRREGSTEVVSPTSRRSRPTSPAGPRNHRPRPISTPSADFIRTQDYHEKMAQYLSRHTRPEMSSSRYINPDRDIRNSRVHAPHLSPQYLPLPTPQSPPAALSHPTPMTPPGPRASFLNMSPVMSMPASPSPSSSLNDGEPVCMLSQLPTLPPISAPRTSDSMLQRTIDDIAGRMNVLNAAYARAQVRARSEALHEQYLHSQPHPQSYGYESMVPSAAQYRSRSMDDSEETSRWSRSAGDSSDKENIDQPLAQMPARKRTSHWDDPSVGNRRVYEGLGRDLGNVSLGANLLHRVPTKDKKSRPPTFDLNATTPFRKVSPGSPMLSANPMSSRLSTASIGVGEFKGWFSNLFNWKAQTFALHSLDGPAAARSEARRLLVALGVLTSMEDGMLRCRVDDGYDPATGTLVQKHVRFRIEFVLPPGPQSGSNHGLLSPPRKNHFSSGVGPREAGLYGCTMLMVQEKGSVSTFRTVYQKLREEWRLDELRSPAFNTDQGAMENDLFQRFAV